MSPDATSSWRNSLNSGHHGSWKTASARNEVRWCGKEFLIQSWCVTNYYPNTMCILSSVLLLESAFLPSAHLNLFFTVQLKANWSQDTSLSSAYPVHWSVKTNPVGFWPTRVCGDHFESASSFTEMRIKSQLDEIPYLKIYSWIVAE